MSVESRIVNEIHGSATKKNKEWQEKLPIVVLRAEEILYSKANSEVEGLMLLPISPFFLTIYLCFILTNSCLHRLNIWILKLFGID